MSKKLRKSNSCYNCSTAFDQSVNFCPSCGQENHSRQASIRILTTDFLNDYLTYDSKLFRSIFPLITKPGFITKEYLDGKRQLFIPPIRVFLFLSFIYFGLGFLLDIETGAASVTTSESDAEITKAISEAFNKYFDLAIFFFTPILAWIIMFFYRSKECKYYVNFFVYSLHLLSLVFILGSIQMLLFVGLGWFVNPETMEIIHSIVQLSAVLFLCVYAVISLKKVFNKKNNILRFFIVLLIAIVVFAAVLIVYLLLIALLYNGSALFVDGV